MAIVAAADGSALGNPGPAGWAWYVDDERWQAGGWPHGTNNQGELMAVLALLSETAHLDDELIVHCDSQYVINSLTKWMPGWKRRGWRKADGSPVLNRDLLTRLDEALRARRVAFEWVRGHTGHELNEAADDRARAAATAYQNGTEVPSGPGWPGAGEQRGQLASLGSASAAVELELFDPEPHESHDSHESHESSAPAGDVVDLERALLDPAVRSDAGRVEALLHPGFSEIDGAGRVWSREEMIRELGREYGESIAIDVLSATLLHSDVALITSRVAGGDGVASSGAMLPRSSLRSSVWVRAGGSWRARFRQTTAES